MPLFCHWNIETRSQRGGRIISEATETQHEWLRDPKMFSISWQVLYTLQDVQLTGGNWGGGGRSHGWYPRIQPCFWDIFKRAFSFLKKKCLSEQCCSISSVHVVKLAKVYFLTFLPTEKIKRDFRFLSLSRLGSWPILWVCLAWQGSFKYHIQCPTVTGVVCYLRLKVHFLKKLREEKQNDIRVILTFLLPGKLHMGVDI